MLLVFDSVVGMALSLFSTALETREQLTLSCFSAKQLAMAADFTVD
jgi:hypothetical protein